MDSHQQQFCLKWNSFGSNLATSFSNLFKSESLTDVTLFCQGVQFKAHRLILAACSKHFQELFEGIPPTPVGLIVILDGTSAQNMSALLEFMYRGEVHVSQESLSSFLKAAECLQVKGLSIEHEKLAVAQRHAAENNTLPTEAASTSNGPQHNGNGANGNSNSSSSVNAALGATTTTLANSSSGNGSSNNNNNNNNSNNNNGSNVSSSNNNNGNPGNGISVNSSNNVSNGSNGNILNNNNNNSNTNNNNNNNNNTTSNNNNNNNNTSSSTSSSSNNNGNGADSPDASSDSALRRGIKRRAPTPASPSPVSAVPPVPAYSLSNVYSAAAQHYYDSPQKRLLRSPSDVDSLGRASVLRDGAAFRPASAPHPLLENHLYQPFNHPPETTAAHPHTAPHTPTELERELERERSEERERNIGGATRDGVAEDLRIKQEPVSLGDRERVDKLAERLSGELYSGSRGSFDSGNYANSTEHAQQQQQQQQQQQHNATGVSVSSGLANLPASHPTTPHLSPAPTTPAMWNTKINKAGTVTTPDGQKLKCPFCERLYGYETNLRAHIRQRHQGIRVPCKYCSRTFTRNNTVRRHVAREHKLELSLKALEDNGQVPDAVPQ